MPRRRETAPPPPSPQIADSDLIPKLAALQSEKVELQNSDRRCEVEILHLLQIFNGAILRLASRDLNDANFIKEIKWDLSEIKKNQAERTEYRKSINELDRQIEVYFLKLVTIAEGSTCHTDNFLPPDPDHDGNQDSEYMALKEKIRELETLGSEFRKRQLHCDELKDLLDHEYDEFEIQSRPVKIALSEWDRLMSMHESLIPFVATIEVAQQYFQFKNYAIESRKFSGKRLLSEINEILRADPQLSLNFNKLGDFEVKRAAFAIMVHYEPNTLYDDMLTNPVFKLVSRTLEEDYVMDIDPLVELEKMIKSNHEAYDAFFRSGSRLPKERWKSFETKEDAQNRYSELRVATKNNSAGRKTPVKRKRVV